MAPTTRDEKIMAEDWELELTRDAEALELAIKREERRKRILRGKEVSEVQRVLEEHSRPFARVIQARKKLALLCAGMKPSDGGGGSGGSSGGRSMVVRHRQEGHIPDNLVTAYEALWIKTYGSGAGYIGDPNALVPTGAGGNQMKMAGSGERVYRGVAKSKPGGSGGRRSIIKDERAFNFKRKIDKRMRRLASEIDEWMRSTKVAGVDISEGEGGVSGGAPRCGGCHKFIDREWRFCASCGGDLRAMRAIALRRDDVRGA